MCELQFLLSLKKQLRMNTELIKTNFSEAQKLTDDFLKDKNNVLKIAQAGALMAKSIEDGGKILTCGNGGSMTDAMHFAEELTGRFRKKRKAIPAIAIADSAHISCVANDFGYAHIFSKYIEAVGKKNDVLLAISTSGNSPNVVNAAQLAKTQHMKIVSLTGKGGGKLAALSNIDICVPWNGFSDRIQEIHIKIIHSLVHYIEYTLTKND